MRGIYQYKNYVFNGCTFFVFYLLKCYSDFYVSNI